MNATYDAVVVGGGFAGVTAARDLVDRRRSVVLLEAGTRIGGRTYTRPFKGQEDLTVDLGGSWVNRELQPEIRREIGRYGIALAEDAMPASAAFITDGVLRSFPVPAGEIADLERVVGHLRDASKRIAPSQRLSRQPIRDLDVSADDFMAPLQLGPATRDLVYAALAWYAGADPRKVSMLGFIAQTAGFGHSPYGFFGALTERIVGGAETLLDRMVEQSRLEIRLDHHVAQIEQDEDGVTVRTRHGECVRARSCVVAVPTNVLRHIDFRPGLADDKQRFLKENHAGRATKPSMLVRHVPARSFALGLGTLQALCLGHEYPDGSCLLMGFGGERTKLDLRNREQVEDAVREYYPEAEVLAVDAYDWNADPLFDGTYRIDPPGQAYDFLRAMNEPEGRVVFAGTDLDDSVWRIWIEGAVHSGRHAADGISVILAR